ncbi:LPS export ABC transporter permease LptG [Oceanibaculum pacificum]|uniref:LPS export ABC transporter permease LptG n=1 Tax=Oceanibaculum pacificum TaxID=580166 RepID=A0A154VJE1_9PROT|nr:LPS export ABC transporter permease LptG [Oceanibaculum pacificum]KZD01547.1 LPS export ABC transporter permease LptG [Oceanibaculum pacificum]
MSLASFSRARIRLSFTLSCYLGQHFLMLFASVFLGIMAIVFIADTVELLRRASSHQDVGFRTVLTMALLKQPNMAQIILPFVVLFAGLLSLTRLTRSQELVVARAAGISVWQFLAPALICALLIGGFRVTIFNPFASILTARYEFLERSNLDWNTNLLSVSDAGLWVRQANGDGSSILHAEGVDPATQVFRGIIVFLYDKNEQFTGRIDAARARLAPGAWQFEQVVVKSGDEQPRSLDSYRLSTDLTLENLQDSFAPPETMSFWELPRFIKVLEDAGFSAQRHRLYLHSLLASPLLLCAMVLIAASFSLRLTRRGGTLTVASGGLFAGFLLYFCTDLVYALGLSGRIPVELAAWTPAAVSLLLGVSLLIHLEDG